MDESIKERKESPAAFLRWKLIQGIFFGFVSLFFLFGFFSAIREQGGFFHTQDYVFQLMMFLCLGGWSVASIGIWLKKQWAERLEEIVLAVIFLGIMICLIEWLFKTALTPEKAGFLFHGFAATVLVLMILWILIGLIIFTSGIRNRSRKESLFLVLVLSIFWPFIMIGKMPFIIIPFFILAIFTGAGEFVGGRYAHPYIGAILGFALFLALAALFVYFTERGMKTKRESETNDAESGQN